MKAVRNVPFELIPEGFVRALGIDYQEFLNLSEFYNNSGAFWNLMVFNGEKKPIAILWGGWDPLERHMRVVRISLHPHAQTLGKELMRYIFNELKLFASSVQASKLYWESSNWRYWLKKLDGLVFVDETKVVQAY